MSELQGYERAQAEALEAVLKGGYDLAWTAPEDLRDDMYERDFVGALDALIRAAKAAEHVAVCGKVYRDPDYATARWESEDTPPRSGEFRQCGHGWECARLAELTKEAT